MNTFPDRTHFTHAALLFSMLFLVPLLIMTSESLSWAESSTSSVSEDTKDQQAVDGSQTQDTDSTSTKTLEEGSDTELDTVGSEPPLITNPMQMSFRITKLDRN